MENATNNEMTEEQVVAREVFLARAFLLGLENTRFGKLVKYLDNPHNKGQVRCPKTTAG